MPMYLPSRMLAGSKSNDERRTPPACRPQYMYKIADLKACLSYPRLYEEKKLVQKVVSIRLER